MPHRTILLSAILLFIINFTNTRAQTKGSEPEERISIEDSVFIFHSPRPLVNPANKAVNLLNAWGADVLFSNNGFGLGFFYQRKLNSSMALSANLGISGARNTDEFQVWNPYEGEYVVYGKVHRLFMFPLTLSLQQYFLQDVLFETLRPHISLGAGPTFILAAPYKHDFFSDFAHSDTYVRPGAFLGLGADVGKYGKTILALNIRYYYIPFGGDGIESVLDHPIKDFGGVFLTLTIGSRY